MAFDNTTRNRLANLVSSIRELLTREFDGQLQELYGIYAAEGRVLDLVKLEHLDDESLRVAHLLRERIYHLAAGAGGASEAITEAVRRVLREQAFTVLNRFAALRMAEERGLIVEAVGAGLHSKGFKLFSEVAFSGLGAAYDRYRVFLLGMFDEMAVDLGVLFDRQSPYGLLFPRETVLLELFDQLNLPAVKPLWKEDETIGWIYQYFNDPAERKKMRELSAAPRNSRELAVRNQFFTPRYVVEFLTDNTLGRIWYEMTQGDTKLKEQCRYLVRRPNEIFLGEGEIAGTPLPFDESLTSIIGDPREAHSRVFVQEDPESYESPTGWVKEAFEGNFENLPAQADLWTRWVGAAIPPPQISTIIGERWQPMESNTKLDHLRRSILDGTPDPEARKLPVVWAILSDFCRTNQFASGYELPTWRKLWSYFRHLAQSWQRYGPAKESDLSQEDLLKQPVHIPHRPLKDPRTILMLDPACGSMHFGLYAFDLFEVIYDEAWELEEKLGADALSRSPGMKSLHATYAGKDAFLKDVPRLIIEHNLHGIDIDPRCAQIAGLSLWLRAQKAWQRLGLKPAERPAIKRSNIVCAEPMPGEKELLREFVEREFPAAERAVCLRLLEAIFDKMQLAGEAGSLLKIEEEIRSAIEDARDAWQKLATRPPELFTTTELNQISTAPELTGLEQAVSSLTTDPRHLTTDFWERIEERIYAALRDYAEQAENGGGFQRRLFAEDAARGFAFIDVCRKRYDVVGMNPPFGERPLSCEVYFQSKFPLTVSDFYAMFYERALALLNNRGKVGAITNRTWLGLPSFEDLRTKVFGEIGCVETAADLGSFVLDAQVETAAAIIGRDFPANGRALWTRLLKTKAKSERLLFAVQSAADGLAVDFNFLASQSQFTSLPSSVYGYWMSRDLISLYKPRNSLGVRGADVKVGAQTSDDERFLRLAWEIPLDQLGLEKDWARFAKGGEFQNFFDDVHLVVRWTDQGSEIAAFPSAYIRNPGFYGIPGVTWPRRTTSAFGPRAFPAGCAFGDKGPVAFPTNGKSANLLLGFLTANPTKLLLSVRLGAGDDAPGSASKSYEVGLVKDLPFPDFSGSEQRIEELAEDAIELVRLSSVEDDESTALFIVPLLVGSLRSGDVRAGAADVVKVREERFTKISQITAEIDERVAEALGFGEPDRKVLWEELERPLVSFEKHAQLDIERFRQAYLTKEAIPGDSLPGGVEAESDVRVQTRRKKQVTLRDAETICRLFEIPPTTFVETRSSLELLREDDVLEIVASFTSYALGVAYGRWDIRYATGEQAAPELPDPFAPLPVCPPGQLQNAQGLPARPEDVPAAYPVRIPWDGILVDDPNHPLDIERRVREVIEIIWSGQEGGPTAEAIEHEACEILGVKSLRDYFRKPAGFFADHLKRYSKSRRQAPIYWPLSTASGSYTLWIYYHRLTDQTLFQCVNDFVKPKITEVEGDLARLTTVGADKTGARGEIERLTTLRTELVEFRDELLRVAQLPYKPNLNDGVLITAAPLWKLFRLPKWQKDLKACWQELEKGDYDWAHLALTLWPDRVKAVCKKDRSIAIAHGLEHLCEVKAPEKKAKRKKKKEQMEMEEEE